MEERDYPSFDTVMVGLVGQHTPATAYRSQLFRFHEIKTRASHDC